MQTTFPYPFTFLQNINEHCDVEQMFTVALRGILYTKESAVVKHFRINFRKIFVLNCNRVILKKSSAVPFHLNRISLSAVTHKKTISAHGKPQQKNVPMDFRHVE